VPIQKWLFSPISLLGGNSHFWMGTNLRVKKMEDISFLLTAERFTVGCPPVEKQSANGNGTTGCPESHLLMGFA
jgi:hypothetical protein